MARFIVWLAKLLHWDIVSPSLDNTLTELPITPLPMPPEAPVVPVETPLDWTSAKGAYHATRVTCDNLGLSLEEKDIICECIYQESGFHNTAVNRNKNSAGIITSTDWGLCQINDWFHIGPGKDFPSVQYVLDNPEKVVEYMINCYKHGQLKMWVSYSSGAYKQWGLPNSPMWKLRT